MNLQLLKYDYSPFCHFDFDLKILLKGRLSIKGWCLEKPERPGIYLVGVTKDHEQFYLNRIGN